MALGSDFAYFDFLKKLGEVGGAGRDIARRMDQGFPESMVAN